MPVELKPLGDRLVVELIEKETITISGILIPEIARQRSWEGMVLATGPGRRDEEGKRIPMDVKEGDRVLFAKYAGTEVKLGTSHDVLILQESDVLAIVGG